MPWCIPLRVTFHIVCAERVGNITFNVPCPENLSFYSIDLSTDLSLSLFYRYTWANYKTNAQIAKELKIAPILDKLLEYKRSWMQHVNRMLRNTSRLPRVMKYYSPTGRRNHGRPLKRLLNMWDRNGSTSGPTPWQIGIGIVDQLLALLYAFKIFIYIEYFKTYHFV